MRIRFGKTLIVAIAMLCVLAPAASADWTSKWSNGHKIESEDGKFKLKFGGRVMSDWTFADDDLFGTEDGNEFRRARFFFSGTVYGNVAFKAEYDFAGGDADFKDVWIQIKKTPIGNIQIGHFKEPFSLEELTSSKYITFLERSLPVMFAPVRNTGIMVFDNHGDRFTWAAGIFRETDDASIGSGDGKRNITARFTGLPLYEDKGNRLIHLGLGLSRKDFGDDPFRFRNRPEVHQTVRFVDTGNFSADAVDILGLEFATVQGPFWAMAEYFQSEVDESALQDPSLGGYYVQAGYFLTGEARPYKNSAGIFDRVKPKSNFGKDGKGAWEIAARFSTLDLTDGALTGGEIDNFTVALNWYLNPVTRFMLNYVDADVDGAGDASFILLRAQIDF